MDEGMTAGDWHDIGAPDEFADQEVVARRAGGADIAVLRLGQELHALADECTHGAARLSDGFVVDGCIECPLHQGQFDVRTGQPRCPPVDQPVRVHPIRVDAGRVQVLVPRTPTDFDPDDRRTP
jgi:anthranilate 1,2-dioxygenase ferredoxin component